MVDVAIIGAGITGAMAARALARYDLKICILEKESDVAMGATRANSAIVHAGFDAKEGTMKARFNVEGSRMMESVCKDLGVPYIKNGSLVLGFDDADREMLENLLCRGTANEVEGLRILEVEELRKMEPNISKAATCALYAPTGAITCPYQLAIAAIGNAMDNGAELKLDFAVSSITKKDGYFEISNGIDTVQARYIINAAGLFADGVAQMAGDTGFSIHPRRGEYHLLDKVAGNAVHATIFKAPGKMGKGILVSPTVDGNLLLGPTAEDIEDKTDTSVTAKGADKVTIEAQGMVQNLPIGKTITSFCGLRAVGSEGDFIIRFGESGILHAAGIESPGLSSAPAIAEYLVILLEEKGLVLCKKEEYNPIRPSMHGFRDMTLEEKNAVIRKDKSFGRIICRCEGVTEGEILNALRQNPRARDLDGVKRRTRAQMGRCQGGFCMPVILELIAKEQGIPVSKVTKSGGKSFVLAEEEA